MPITRESFIRLASVIAGVPNHDARIRDAEYAYQLTRNPVTVRDYHATLGIANRLELLVADATPPVHFIVADIADGALRAPVVMFHAVEQGFIRYVRSVIQGSPVYQLEITADREIVLWSFVYDHGAHTSALAVFDSSLSQGEEVAIRRAS